MSDITDPTTDPTALLGDVRVVDLTDGYAAFTSRLLGDLGADVVRVEPPGGGVGRRRTPRAADGTSLHYFHRNVGKSVVEIDPALDEGRRAVEQLLAGADIVVVSDGWGHERHEMAAAQLSDRHPHLVVVSVTPYGLEGPGAEWPATELVAQALAGVVYRSGVPELPPVSAPGSYCEDVGSATSAMAALMALWQVRHGSSGQVVDTSTVLALAQCTEMSLPLWSLLDFDQVRSGSGLYPLFECSDGLARLVLPMTANDWRSLIAWLGNPPEWTGAGWEAAMLGEEERAQIMQRLPAKFAGRTREEVTIDGEAAGLRVTPVLTPAELLENPHVVARGTFTEMPVGPDARPGSVMAGLFGVGDVRAEAGGPPEVIDQPPAWPARPRPAAEPAPTSKGPLAGLRVLEIGTGVAAPEAGRLLAEWGADVIKVETSTRADFQRRVLGGDMNPAFATVARAKRALGVDLGAEEGREVVRALLAQVDVLIENNATGVIDRLGLGWDDVSAINPRLVMVGSQLYGTRGPWAGRKGYGPSARAVGGLTWLWAHGADAPRGVMTIHPDHLAGRLVAFGALAGLSARERTGRGCHLDVAQFEAVAALLGDLLLAESLEAGTAQPLGNRHPEHAPWNLYRGPDETGGAESWIAVCVADDGQWAALASEVPELNRPEWATEAGRLAEAEAVDAAVAAWVGTVVTEDAERRLLDAGVPAGRALSPRLQAEHPLFVERGYVVPLDQPGSGLLLLEGPCFTGSGLGEPHLAPAPALGEHTADICRDLLDMDEAEIGRLVAAGALEVARPAE